MIQPMRLFEEPDVRAIYATCHPGWPAKPQRWYEAHPTLVLIEAREIIGFTAYSIGPSPAGAPGDVMYGHGVYVAASFRGAGFGYRLAEERLEIARGLGIGTFCGMTQPDNAAMVRIFEAQGLTQMARVELAYPDGSPALIYVGKP